MSEVKRWSIGVDGVDPNGDLVRHADYAALKAERDKLSAENAALKQWAKDADELWTAGCDLDGHLDCVPQTPATDATIAEIKAQGVEAYCLNVLAVNGSIAVEMLKPNAAKIFDHLHEEAMEFAARLRKGGDRG